MVNFVHVYIHLQRMTQKEAADKLGMKRDAFAGLLCTRKKVEAGPSGVKRVRKGKASAVESALLKFIHQSCDQSASQGSIAEEKSRIFCWTAGRNFHCKWRLFPQVQEPQQCCLLQDARWDCRCGQTCLPKVAGREAARATQPVQSWSDLECRCDRTPLSCYSTDNVCLQRCTVSVGPRNQKKGLHYSTACCLYLRYVKSIDALEEKVMSIAMSILKVERRSLSSLVKVTNLAASRVSRVSPWASGLTRQPGWQTSCSRSGWRSGIRRYSVKRKEHFCLLTIAQVIVLCLTSSVSRLSFSLPTQHPSCSPMAWVSSSLLRCTTVEKFVLGSFEKFELGSFEKFRPKAAAVAVSL